jgi:hypothetical protein
MARRLLSADLPLNNESKRVLAFGAEQAQRVAYRHIGTEHLLLGLLREEKQPAAKLFAGVRSPPLEAAAGNFGAANTVVCRQGSLGNKFETVEIHGERWNRQYVREIVKTFRKFNWPLEPMCVERERRGGPHQRWLDISRPEPRRGLRQLSAGLRRLDERMNV